MINFGSGDTDAEAGANKAAGKALLQALVDAWEAGDPDEEAPAEVDVPEPDLVAGTWRPATC